jgi:alpha-beta hydrolase superfamily lysophospholipase
MQNETFSSQGCTLGRYKWLVDDPKGILLILHGMSEHAARYEHFAHFLNTQSISVYAHDHRGHGRSKNGHCGHFSDVDGWELVVEDVKNHIALIKEERQNEANIPFVILGHSMGSFITQEFILRYPKELSGVILSGSDGSPDILARIGRYVARLERLRKGGRGISTILNKLSFEDFNKAFAPNRTRSDWLSRDEKEVDLYLADESCGFDCSNQLWIDLLDGLVEMSKKERQKNIPSDLPILIFSGSEDPVGKNTKGVRTLLEAYAKAGLKKVTYTFYPGGRHEMLNETNKMEVYQDVVDWLKTSILMS